MKTVSNLMLLSLTVAIITIVSCKKDATPEPVTNPPVKTTTTPPPATSGLSSLNSLFEHKGAQSQNFTIDNNSTQIITGAQGTKITFSPNSFVTLAGAIVTGNINIELKEIYDKKMMVLSNVTTNSEAFLGGPKSPLVSGGEYYLNASQGGAQLKLAPGRLYDVFLPSPNPGVSGMSYFNGRIAGDSGIVWSQNSNCFTLVTPSNVPGGYFMMCDSLRWCNCDKICAAANGTTTITLNLSGEFDASQMVTMFWDNSDKTVCNFDAPFNSVTKSYAQAGIPIGVPAHLIVISVKNGKLYTGIISTNIAINAVYNLTLTETTEDAFANSLTALP